MSSFSLDSGTKKEDGREELHRERRRFLSLPPFCLSVGRPGGVQEEGGGLGARPRTHWGDWEHLGVEPREAAGGVRVCVCVWDDYRVTIIL